MNLLAEISSSGSLAANISTDSGSFEVSLFSINENSVLMTLEDRTSIKNLRKQKQVLDDAIKLIDHAHPGALFQVRRGLDNMMSLEFASPRLGEVLGIPGIEVENFVELIGEAQRHELFETFRNCQDELMIRGEIPEPQRYWKIMANILDQDDQGTVFLGVLENSTARISQMNQLEYTTNFLKSITTNIPIGISISDIETKKYLYVNPELSHITGYSEEEFLTQGLALTKDKLLVDPEEDFFTRLDNLRAYFLSKRPAEDFAIKGIVRVRTKSGDIRVLNIIFRPLGKPDHPEYGKNFIHITEDITDKVSFEEQRRNDEILLVQSNKMAELGEMASCLAHEINNPLSILTHLLEDLADNHSDEIVFEKSFHTLERINKIVKALTSFARDTGDEGPGDEPVSLKQILDDTLLLCHNKLTNARIDFKITGDLSLNPFINDTMLSQVLLNLINNSFDSIQDKSGEKHILLVISSQKNKIHLEFSDSGIAPSLETCHKWFTPFYTSKPKGKGTGLGLTICKNLLMAAGGDIKPVAAKNTTFLVTLPIWPHR
tara:strand:+ start:4071 stop:5711 length:1641 start_codon:yes stop_codon:yes gene_type:complete